MAGVVAVGELGGGREAAVFRFGFGADGAFNFSDVACGSLGWGARGGEGGEAKLALLTR
jgi:hypothetical protein